jgi:glutamate decarboxylase
VPAHSLAQDLTSITVQRNVVRNGLSMDLADRFLEKMASAAKCLDRLDGPLSHEGCTVQSFRH